MSSEPVEVKAKSRNPFTYLRNASPTKLDRTLRLVNVLNAALLMTSGVLTFTPIPTANVLLVLASLYVIAFSCILCCFESHLGFIERIVYRDCGFMFRWYGRLLFFAFVGTLAFALGIIGIIAGAVTILNVFFNLCVLHFSPTYAKFRELQVAEINKNYGGVKEAWAAEMQQMKQQVVQRAAEEVVKETVNSVKNSVSGGSSSSSSSSSSNERGEGGWERVYDEESGGYYYYNAKTRETTWDEPKKGRYDDRVY